VSGSTVLETFSYAYNADGQLTSASSPDSAYAYAYDGEGRTASVDNNGTPNVPDVVLSDQYDANGNRTQLAATIAGTADFQNVYTYDALDRLTQLYQQGQTGGNAVATKGANLTYNLLGQLATVARTNFFGIGPAPDIATSTFSYDTANRLTEIANTTNGGTAIDAYSWAYDLADRVTSMTTTTDGTATYSYDNTNQVTGVTYTTNPGATQPANESYSFDSNGNRTNTGYSTGTNNQLTSDGTFNYTYDHEGNRISRTRISNDPANDYLTTYTFDYRNRLTDVNFYNNSDVLTKHVHNIYDVFGHLIGKQVDSTGSGGYDRAEFYVYDGNNVALQFGLGGALTERYLSGPSASGVDTVLAEEDVASLTSPGTVTWPLTDNLGTVRDIVDSTGAVIDHLVDNSFGQVAYESAPTVHHLESYTGAVYDPDTGLVNDWRRWYDPAVGRWISEDPIGFTAGDANLSRYVANSPANFTDASGLDRWIVTNGFHWWITVEQWGVGADGQPHVMGYSSLHYSCGGFTILPGDMSSVTEYWSTNGPAAPGTTVVYHYYSNIYQDLALLNQWAQMTNYTFNFGYALGYALGINCISMSDYWASYGGIHGPAAGPVDEGLGLPDGDPHPIDEEEANEEFLDSGAGTYLGAF